MHNFKHILVKREDNQLVCLCYPELPPQLYGVTENFPKGLGQVQYTPIYKAWEESAVKIPLDGYNDDFLMSIYSGDLTNGILVNPELVEIRRYHMIDGKKLATPQKFAYLSSPKEEKAAPKWKGRSDFAKGFNPLTCGCGRLFSEMDNDGCCPCGSRWIPSVYRWHQILGALAREKVLEHAAEMLQYEEPKPIPQDLYLKMKKTYDDLKAILDKQPVEEVKEEESQNELWKEANRLYNLKNHTQDGRDLQMKNFIITRKYPQ